MGLFDKLNKPVFLKEDSDLAQFIGSLKELQDKTQGNIRDRIDREIKLATIGEVGENNIAFELKNSGIPMYIMHDVHLEVDDLSAQIDYLVVTRKVAFIIECKNLIGNIDIDSGGNFIRSYSINGKKVREGIYSPITQNQRHLDILRQIRRNSKSNFVTKMLFDKFFDENYKSVVVLANPKTILNAEYAKEEIKRNVIRADQLINYIKQINIQANLAELNDKDMKERAEGLLKLHTPNKSDYIKKYEEIIINISDAGRKQPEEVNIIEEDKLNDIEPAVDNKLVGDKDELIKKLKVFRLNKSREENIKPYYIFNDSQMMDLLSKMPISKEALKGVTGFGEVKTEKYGDMIIGILNEHR